MLVVVLVLALWLWQGVVGHESSLGVPASAEVVVAALTSSDAQVAGSAC